LPDLGNSDSTATLREAAPREWIIPRITQPYLVSVAEGAFFGFARFARLESCGSAEF
jgi:hypothetical protein